MEGPVGGEAVLPLMEDKRVLDELNKVESLRDQGGDEPWAVKRMAPYSRQSPEDKNEVAQPAGPPATDIK